MGFEPRAAERLRLAVASAKGALDDIAHLIASTAATEGEEPSMTAARSEQDGGRPRGRTAA
jgi:hypothetical protein